MSIPRGKGQNGGHYYSNLTSPVEIDLNFIVDSTSANGLRSLKSNGYVKSVSMNTSANAPAGTPALGTARSFGLLGASAVTNTGSSTVAGNIGVSPGSAISGFPPGAFTGSEHITDVAAAAAQSSAQSAYTSMQAQSPTVIATALDGQTLVPGVYKAASGTFTLAQAAGGTLTLNGAGVYILQTTTTLTTGAGGIPVITLSGGARASDVYWVVGSSATINSGFAGVFQGNVIANTSITDTLGGTVNGSLIALNGAVTLSAASVIATQSLSGGGPSLGYAKIIFNNNFNKFINLYSSFESPESGSSLTSVVSGNAYVITSLGTASLAQWQAVGVRAGLVPALGMSFIASASQSIGGSAAVQVPLSSGINSVEVVGSPNLTLNNSNVAVNSGAEMVVQFLSNGTLIAPRDSSVCSMTFKFDGSSVTIDGL